jgi:DHA1 family bicyclomycin/chloramphenicol resistance-like MFS transporter
MSTAVETGPPATAAATAAVTSEGTDPGEPSARERIRLIVVLGLLVAIGPLTIDMYLPSLPTITAGLHTTAAMVQLTLTGTLLGLALGQLFIGPLSDAIGRRLPLLAGIGVHIGASILCVFAPSISVLGTLRLLQGLGVAASSVVATAVVRDKFSGTTAAKVFSRLLLVMGVAPILAPTLGSQILRLTSWRGVFATLAALGAALLVMAVFALPETLAPALRRHGGIRGTLRDYRALLRDRTFVGLVLVAGFSMAALFAYVAGSSFVYQDEYGLSQQQFGLVFGGGAAGLIAASQLNVRLLNRYGPQQILLGALVIGSAASAALLTFASTGFGGVVSVALSLLCVLAAGGLAIPNAPALAMNRHGDAAGTAAALLGAVQFGVGALAAPAVGALGTGAVAMGVVVAASMLAGLGVLVLVVRPARLEAVTVEPAASTVH